MQKARGVFATLSTASWPVAQGRRQRQRLGTPQQPRSAIRRPSTRIRVVSSVPALPAGASVAALLLPEASAAAGGGLGGSVLPAAFSHVTQLVDPRVAGATVGASAKLAMLCALVGWLLKTGQLPVNTASVLSRVSFTLLIPAMLFTKVAATLAARPDPSVLATISLVILLQVGAGALLAELVAPAVDRLLILPQGPRPAVPAAPGEAAGAGSLSETGLRRLVTLASSFGSSFTLPVVFLTQMLPAVEAERALGFTALILLSWSPLMWSLGLAMIRPGGGDDAGGAAASGPAAQPAPAGGAAAEAAAALAEPPLASAARRVAAAWRAAVSCGRHALTPPILAMLAGMLAGLTPWGRTLVGDGGATAAAAAAGSAPAASQAALARVGGAVLRSAMDVLKMLAGGTLAAQTVVLAASLLQKPEGQQQQQQQAGGRGGPLAGLRALLLPANGAEARALATVAITRFLLLPSLTAGAVWGLGRAGLLPAAVASDPVLLLVLLVEAVMPSAQNLIVLCSLSASTSDLVPLLASLLVKLYALSILPVSAWVSCWATWLGMAVP